MRKIKSDIQKAVGIPLKEISTFETNKGEEELLVRNMEVETDNFSEGDFDEKNVINRVRLF